MTHYTLSVGLAVTVSLAMTGLLVAGEPSGIGEKGTGQTKKSTERQQSGNQPDMSQVPAELSEGKSAQAAQDLTAIEQKNRRRGPFDEASMFSAVLEPLKSNVSVPAWPSTMSLPSPGSH